MGHFANLLACQGAQRFRNFQRAAELVKSSWPAEQAEGFDLETEMHGDSKRGPLALLLAAFDNSVEMIAVIGVGNLGPDGVWAKDALWIGYDDSLALVTPELRRQMYAMALSFCREQVGRRILICTERDEVIAWLNADESWKQLTAIEIIAEVGPNAGQSIGSSLVYEYQRS